MDKQINRLVGWTIGTDLRQLTSDNNLSPNSIRARNGNNYMNFHNLERVAVFIDGANLYSTARGLNIDIDFRKLLSLFQETAYLVRAYYYTALAEDQEYSSVRPLIDWLDYNGYTVVTKPMKEFTDSLGRRKVKGNMDTELTIDVMELSDQVDHIVIFSGDGDFRRLVEAVQRKGKRVTVASTLKTQPPMIADELRRQADHFIEIAAILDKIARAPGERPPRRTSDDDEPNGNMAEDDDFMDSGEAFADR